MTFRAAAILAGLALPLANPFSAPAQVLPTNAIGVSPTVSTVVSGSVLSAQGGVSADGRYVTMSLQPSFSSLDGFDTFSSGGTFATPTAIALHSIPFRSAVVGKLTFVSTDKRLLAKPVKPMIFKDLSFKATLQKLAAATNTNIVLGIRGMQQAGIDIDTPHTYAIDAGTLKDAILAITRAAVPDDDLVITADEDVLRVVTQAQADASVVTRTYDLDDFLANLPRVIPPTMDLGTLKDDKPPAKKAVRTASAGPVKTAPRSAAANHAPSAARKAAPARPDSDVLRLVTASVRPEIWKSNGGKYSDIAIVGPRVVVTAPESVQVLFQGPARPRQTAPMYIGVGQ